MVLYIFLPWSSQLHITVQVNRPVIFSKVHEAICTHVVYLQLVIKVNRGIIVLITSVGSDFPYYLVRWFTTDRNSKGAIATIRCLEKTSEVRIGLNMSEDGFSSIQYFLFLNFCHLKLTVKTIDFSTSLAASTFLVLLSASNEEYLSLVGSFKSSCWSKLLDGMIWNRLSR